RHSDAAAVAEAVRAILPEREESARGRRRRRGVCVFQPVGGWVGVLDTGDADELARGLSARLGTEALFVLVNDSDSWAYLLYRGGRLLDEFDSSGDTLDDGEFPPEVAAALARGDERAAADLLEREMLARAPQGPIWFPNGRAAPPPALALLRERIREGR